MEDATQPIPARKISIDQGIIEAAAKAIARERGRSYTPSVSDGAGYTMPPSTKPQQVPLSRREREVEEARRAAMAAMRRAEATAAAVTAASAVAAHAQSKSAARPAVAQPAASQAAVVEQKPAPVEQPLESVMVSEPAVAEPARQEKAEGAHAAAVAVEREEPAPVVEREPRVVPTDPAEITSEYLDAFFSELERCGVTDYVISPGSRSTGLAMKAFERFGSVYVDVDERGAAFFALGLAKAKRQPVAVICTSGTAVGNWMPAVLEAESSRVPLLLLSGDRPSRLQGLGAPQTCDQLKMFGDHVKKFVQMPQPAATDEALAFARQTALEACVAAHGSVPGASSCDGGPVHINFPFDEPLKPARSKGNEKVNPLPPTVVPGQGLRPGDARGIFKVFHGKRTIALCGEGTCNNAEDVQVMLEFAHKCHIPLLADPLSGLRCVDDPYVIDNYDTVFGGEAPRVDVVIRFGRWPVSKRCFTALQEMNPTQIAVDMRDTRDYSASTSLFVHALPVVFAAGMIGVRAKSAASVKCVEEWMAANDEARERITSVPSRVGADDFEGAYVAKMMSLIPEGSLLFSASSMSIRAIDTFYCKSDKNIRVLCNRGLNGIDGTLSSAIGAAQAYEQTTVLTGDLAFLHDANALSLQNEMHIREIRHDGPVPSIIVVLLNNNGGAIFDMLPQKSTEDYFGRLFLTPQNVDCKHLAQAFGAGYRRVSSVHDFRRIYESFLGEPGINIIDVSVPLAGVEFRYGRYW